LREQDAFAFIRLYLPAVDRMRLADVNDKKLDAIAKATMERLEVPSLGTKGRSGVAAENQRDRFVSAKCRKPHSFVVAKLGQLKVWGVSTRCGRVSLALGKKLHERDAPPRGHCVGELHHASEIFFGEMSFEQRKEIFKRHRFTFSYKNGCILRRRSGWRKRPPNLAMARRVTDCSVRFVSTPPEL
jgi:hypothetical protein